MKRKGLKTTLGSGNTIAVYRTRADLIVGSEKVREHCLEYQMYNGAIKTTILLTPEAVEAMFVLYKEATKGYFGNYVDSVFTWVKEKSP